LQQEPLSHAEQVEPPKKTPLCAKHDANVAKVHPPAGKQHDPLEHAMHVIPELNTPRQSYLKTFSVQTLPEQQEPLSHAFWLKIPGKKAPAQSDCLTPTCLSPFTQQVPIMQREQVAPTWNSELSASPL